MTVRPRLTRLEPCGRPGHEIECEVTLLVKAAIYMAGMSLGSSIDGMSCGAHLSITAKQVYSAARDVRMKLAKLKRYNHMYIMKSNS